MAERTAAESSGSPGILKLFANGLSRVTGRNRHSASTSGTSPPPCQGLTQTEDETAAGNHTPQQQQIQADGARSASESAADPESPAGRQAPAHAQPEAVQPKEDVTSSQELFVPDTGLQLQLAHPWNPLSWPSQAMKAAEQRPCPVKRSSDIFDLIDAQLATSKRRRLEPAASASVSGQLALTSSQPPSQWPAASAVPVPVRLDANQGVSSWQSPTGKSPFRRYIAPPQPSRLSRPASAPFTAGRPPAASPAPTARRSNHAKGQNTSLHPRRTASPSVSPVKTSSKAPPSNKQPAFRLGQSDVEAPFSSLPALPQAHVSPRAVHFGISDAVERLPSTTAAWTPMKSTHPALAATIAERQSVVGKQPAPGSLLAAGLHAQAAVSTPGSARARRFQGRAPSAQKRKAAELEASEPQAHEEASEAQRLPKQARRGGEDVSHSGSAQSLDAVPPPTAVLGFLPYPFSESAKAAGETTPRNDTLQLSRSQSPGLDEANKPGPTDRSEVPPQVAQPKAKDYGAPWAAAAAAADVPSVPPASSQPDAAVQPGSSSLGPPPQPSKTPEPQEKLASVLVSAPSPFTAPPKPFGMLLPSAAQAPPFQGFGSIASDAPTQAKTPVTHTVSHPAAASASDTSKPAAFPTFPAFSPGVFAAPAQPAAPSSTPAFAFGVPPGTSLSTEGKGAPSVTQGVSQQGAAKSAPDKPDNAAQRPDREASVASDVSGDTAVDEQQYAFSNQRSAQDKLEGLIDPEHQAADDVDGLYTFGKSDIEPDQNEHEGVASQDPPVTPLQNGFPTQLEADRLQALAMAVPLPSPTPSTSEDPPQPDLDPPASSRARSVEIEAADDIDAAAMDVGAADDIDKAARDIGADNAVVATTSQEEEVHVDATTHAASETDDADAATIVLSSGDSQANSSAKSSSSSSSTSSDDEDVSSVGTTSDEEAAGAATPVLHPHGDQNAGPSHDPPAAGGWGNAFLKANQSAAKAAADAAAEADKAKAQQEKATSKPPAMATGWDPAFLQGNQSAAKAAADAAAEPDVADAQQAAPQSTSMLSTPPAAATWGADFLNANQSQAKAAADSAAQEAKAAVSQPAPKFQFGRPQASMPAFQAALNVPLPSFDSPVAQQPNHTSQALVDTRPAAVDQPALDDKALINLRPVLDAQPTDSDLLAAVSDPAVKEEPVETEVESDSVAQIDDSIQPDKSLQAGPNGAEGAKKPRRFLRRKQK